MGEVRLSVEDITNRITEMLKEKRPEKRVSICKAPMVLREKDKNPYIPKWVSVGPYHHNAEHLSSDIDTQKMRAVHRIMSRLSLDNPPKMSSFTKIVNEVKKYESKIRDNYEMDIKCNGDDLAHMMVLDGCFVLEILRCLSDKPPNDDPEFPDPFFNRHNIEYASYSLLTDILLLENQIPLLVLIKLLKLEMETESEARRKLSKMFIKDRQVGRLFYPFVFKEEDWRRDVEDLLAGEEAAHLLDIASRLARGNSSPQLEDAGTRGKRKCLCFSIICKYLCFSILCKKRRKVETDYMFTIPTATELHEAGIKFEACAGGLTTVRFRDEDNTLQLPIINVTTSAGIFLRNLMAYETYKWPKERVISNFAVLMDELINNEKDVKLLRQCGIIHGYTLGSDGEVASFFNSLRKGTAGACSSSTDTFSEQRKKVREYYENEYRVMFAEFVRVHFSKPWLTVSVLAAVVLLVLTVVQTIYTIIDD